MRSVAAIRKPNSVPASVHPRRTSADDDHSSSPVIADRVQQPTRRPQAGRLWNASLFGLAPCGVLPATRVATRAVRSYRTFSPLPTVARSAKAGGMFSVPLSFGLPRPGVTRRTALRSSDFPPLRSHPAFAGYSLGATVWLAANNAIVRHAGRAVAVFSRRFPG